MWFKAPSIWLYGILSFSLSINPTLLYADDTEIFMGRSASPGVQSNVLFILDNSDSMGQPFSGGGPTRLEALKESFSQIIGTVEGINVGIMRFDGPGGSVAYPVTDVAASVNIPYIENPEILDGSGDAIENQSTGTVTIDDNTLVLNHDPGGISNFNATASIKHEDDDVEQDVSDGRFTKSFHTKFNIMSSQVNALRYINLGIPVGATIDSARIRFTAANNDTSSATVLITADSATNPVRVNTSDRYNVTNRAAASQTVTWNITDNWVQDRLYYTDDLSAIVQEAIDRPGWSSNDALFFIFDHQSGASRAGYQFKSSDLSTQGINGKGPVLEIAYHTGSGAPSQLTTGLRFQNVAIPRGATIERAYINFTASSSASGTSSYNVQVQNSGNASAFTATNNDITNSLTRPRYASTVVWPVTEDWIEDDVQPGPEVTSLVQAVVNRTDWCGNNAMAFFISGSSTVNRYAYAFDAGDDREPKLVVEYSYDADGAPPGTGCINSIFSNYLASKEQDAEQQSSGNSRVSNDGTALVIDSGNLVGLRFKQIPIVQGGTIMNAYLRLFAHPDGNNTGSVTIKVEGHDDANAPAFPETRNNIGDRTRTSASVSWGVSSDWADEMVYESDDISSVIQEIINRGDWEPGNSLALILSTSSANERQVYSWDGASGKSAQLVIQVADGGIDTGNNTVRQHLDAVVQGFDAITEVPVVDTLYEAARYYRGESVYYGRKRELFDPQADNTDTRYKRVSHADSYSGGSHSLPVGCPSSTSNAVECEEEEITGAPTYISPIDSSCQSNHIILLTNGLPTTAHQPSWDGINAYTSGWKGRSCETDSSRNSERCSRDLVEWMANVDQRPSIAGYDNVINTHTIALNVNSTSFRDYLQDIASLGGGLFKEANSSAELSAAFDDIIRSVLKLNTTFVSPGATINQFNRLTHRNEIYFSLFKPDRNPKWAGNLKRYKLLGNPPTISDVNDEVAVDSETGFFKTSSQSVWSAEVDGNDVEKGGAAYKLPEPSERKAYTYLSTVEGSSRELTNVKNKLHEENTLITQAMLGVSDSSERNQVLKWSRGVDLNDWDGDTDELEQRLQMGDPLHSIPVLVTYGGTDENPDIVVFVGTNEGFLHAIKAEDGTEHFSFIPEELLGNLDDYYTNTSAFDHPYGLDGSPVVWVNDHDHDGEIGTDDHVYLYIGMRRGGLNYYALDVTDVNAPSVLWTIKGGSGDFSRLGQTWSRPIKTRVKIGSEEKMVLIFGGGFDPDQDNTTVITPDDIGNAIYMVDAETGERLWVGYDGATVLEGENFSDMDYGIPGDLSIIDINQDGFAEQIYAADVGGQIWRFDINNGESVSGLVDGGVIARLSDSGINHARRFFNKPNVSLISAAGKLKLSLSIGSGTRFNPLNEDIIDRFYTLYFGDVFNKPSTYRALTESDLVDRTRTDDDSVITSGWYITMENVGEKVLANSVTVNNTVFFNTYSPEAAANSCQAVAGQGRTYAVNVFNGNAAFDLNSDGDIDGIADRSRVLSSGAIPPAPKLLISEEGILTLLVGPEQPYSDTDLGGIRTDRWFNSYWYERK